MTSFIALSKLKQLQQQMSVKICTAIVLYIVVNMSILRAEKAFAYRHFLNSVFICTIMNEHIMESAFYAFHQRTDQGYRPPLDLLTL